MTRAERKADRRRRELERLRRLAFDLVTWPINPTTESRRLEIVLVEAPRFDPDRKMPADVAAWLVLPRVARELELRAGRS